MISRFQEIDLCVISTLHSNLTALTARSTAARPRPEPGRRKSLPAHLPRIEVIIEPETTSCPCCGSSMQVIGEEKSERLDVIPAPHRILVTRRPKYGCRTCAGAVVQAAAPERLIRSGLPTEALVAYVLVSKYAWHLPLYRQAQILLAQGIEIDRSVLAFWVGYAAAELMALWRHLREILLGAPLLFVDETRAPVLDPGRGRTKSGYFWSIARDDSAWRGGTGPPAVVYTYAPGRGAEHAMTLLGGYRGIVQCDGYAAYKQVAHRGRAGNAVILAFCWAHWRRRFHEIAKAGSAPIAEEALRRMGRASLIETCKLNGVDGQAYLTGALTKLVNLWPAVAGQPPGPTDAMGMAPQRRVGGVTDAFTYAELDEILRGTGRSATARSSWSMTTAALSRAIGPSASRSGSGCAPRRGASASCSQSTARCSSRSWSTARASSISCRKCRPRKSAGTKPPHTSKSPRPSRLPAPSAIPIAPPKHASNPPGSHARRASADRRREPTDPVKPHRNGVCAPLTFY